VAEKHEKVRVPGGASGYGLADHLGELALLTPRPAILVYAHTASFQLWPGVLEAAGAGN
jgi:hypothetical protein